MERAELSVPVIAFLMVPVPFGIDAENTRTFAEVVGHRVRYLIAKFVSRSEIS
jgi:hypothetical protein